MDQIVAPPSRTAAPPTHSTGISNAGIAVLLSGLTVLQTTLESMLSSSGQRDEWTFIPQARSEREEQTIDTSVALRMGRTSAHASSGLAGAIAITLGLYVGVGLCFAAALYWLMQSRVIDNLGVAAYTLPPEDGHRLCRLSSGPRALHSEAPVGRRRMNRKWLHQR